MNIETVVQRCARGSKPIRVLLADPDESLEALYGERLWQEGFEMITAFSGIECLTQMRHRIPDVLVLEPLLPWGGGDGVLAMMSEFADWAAIPVMVLTGCHNLKVLEHVARYPISDYHVKPLPPDRLARELRNLLHHPERRFALADQSGFLKCLIVRRTGGRVRNLLIESIDGRIRVRGCCDSYHVRQLVIAAVLESQETSESESGKIDLNLDVLCGD